MLVKTNKKILCILCLVFTCPSNVSANVHEKNQVIRVSNKPQPQVINEVPRNNKKKQGKKPNKYNCVKNKGKIKLYNRGTKAYELKNLDQREVINKVSELFQKDQKESGILASVSMAQFILESRWGKSDLAQDANNLFGMKAGISNNNWEGSVWNGELYFKVSREYDSSGKCYDKHARFRSYPSIEKSIVDHSAYLNNAKNGNEKKYKNIKNCKDYKEAFQIIKGGGYATDPDYVDKLCQIVKKWDLTKFDKK